MSYPFLMGGGCSIRVSAAAVCDSDDGSQRRFCVLTRTQTCVFRQVDEAYLDVVMKRFDSDDSGPSFAYSLPVHSFRTRRDRVASLTTCCLHGSAIQSASPLGPGRALTLPCGWNNAGRVDHTEFQTMFVFFKSQLTEAERKARPPPSTRRYPLYGEKGY